MEFDIPREAAALNQRIRRVLSMFRIVAAHVGGNSSDAVESALRSFLVACFDFVGLAGLSSIKRMPRAMRRC